MFMLNLLALYYECHQIIYVVLPYITLLVCNSSVTYWGDKSKTAS